MRVAAVVLDMDGLVLDTEPLYKAVWQEAALWRLRVAHTGIPLKPGLLEFLSFVEGQRLPIAVATSSDRDYTEFSLRHAGLLHQSCLPRAPLAT